MAELAIIGGGDDPSGCYAGSAYALVRGKATYLLDCGEGCAARLSRCGIDPLSVRGVFISHMHYDHMAGMFGLLTTMWMLSRSEEDIPASTRQWANRAFVSPAALPHGLAVYVPAEAAAAVEGFLPTVYLAKDIWRFDLAVRPISSGLVHDDGILRLQAHSNRHLSSTPPYIRLAQRFPSVHMESYGFTAEVDKTIVVYSGDLAAAGKSGVEEFRAAASGADVVIAEVAHVPPEDLVSMLADTRAKRIILVHMHKGLDARLNACLRDYPGQRFIRAIDGTRITLS